MKLDKLII